MAGMSEVGRLFNANELIVAEVLQSARYSAPGRPAGLHQTLRLSCEHAGPDVAARFRLAVQQTYQDLARMPEMGSLRKFPDGRHAGIRLWPVRGFKNYWIAYYPHRDGVAIERLFHAKQDYERIMQ